MAAKKDETKVGQWVEWTDAMRAATRVLKTVALMVHASAGWRADGWAVYWVDWWVAWTGDELADWRALTRAES